MTASTSDRQSAPDPDSFTTWGDQSTSSLSADNLHGTKRGSLPELPAEHLCKEALVRLSKRYEVAVKRSVGMREVPYSVGEDHFHIPMSEGDRKKLGDWFMARYNYLQEVYRHAINADERIIAGKQQIFDSRPKLGDWWDNKSSWLPPR